VFHTQFKEWEMQMVHAALVLGLGLLLTVVRCPDAAAQQIRNATLADVPLMVELAGRQDPRSSATDEDTRRLTALLEQPETLAVVSETEGRVTGGVVAARHSVPGAEPPESIYTIAWLQVAEDPAGALQQALLVEVVRQAAARGVSVAIAAQPG
jgi:hypothetical protein